MYSGINLFVMFQMLNLRQILTKLLMDVTNDMMLSVVKEVLKNTLQTGNIFY